MNIAVDPQSATRPSLRLERLIAAPVERVYDYWTRAELLARWLAPGEVVVADSDVDLQPGGAWFVTMRHPDGHTSTVEGIYLALEPPHRLVFTWGSNDSHCAAGQGETEVEIALAEVPGGTRLVLTHTKFATVEQRDRHEMGWGGCLDKLERVAR